MQIASMKSEILKALPKSKLFDCFKHYRENIAENHSNLDFVLWGEDLLEEISLRKLSFEFEEALNEKPRLRLVVLN